MTCKRAGLGLASAAAVAAVAWSGAVAIAAGAHSSRHVALRPPARAGSSSRRYDGSTTTPIKHLVVIYQENVSFDHYFGTYPHAINPPREPAFTAAPDTPTVNGFNENLLTMNPNSANPQRLDRSMPLTCDQDHDYTPEQQAFDHGLMDKFVPYTDTESCSPPDQSKPGLVMDYYDGNTVTAMWNYAQHYSLNDSSFGTVFGPSTPGALDLTSGQTHGATPANEPDSSSNGTVIGDPDPAYDDCSGSTTVAMSGRNIGDLLNSKGITWGWFEGGFRPTSTSNGKAVCGSSHQNIGGATQTDYSPHHEPFQYYSTTANPHHLPPSASTMIGHTDQANHQYDLSDFWTAVDAGDMPASVVPQGGEVPGRPRRLLRPARRAALPGRHDQPARAIA